MTKREERIREAANLHVKTGQLQRYCELMVELGEVTTAPINDYRHPLGGGFSWNCVHIRVVSGHSQKFSCRISIYDFAVMGL